MRSSTTDDVTQRGPHACPGITRPRALVVRFVCFGLGFPEPKCYSCRVFNFKITTPDEQELILADILPT
jgi:hypothetical protein